MQLCAFTDSHTFFEWNMQNNLQVQTTSMSSPDPVEIVVQQQMCKQKEKEDAAERIEEKIKKKDEAVRASMAASIDHQKAVSHISSKVDEVAQYQKEIKEAYLETLQAIKAAALKLGNVSWKPDHILFLQDINH